MKHKTSFLISGNIRHKIDHLTFYIYLYLPIYIYIYIHTHTHMYTYMYISQLLKKYNIFENCIKHQYHMISFVFTLSEKMQIF